MYDFKEQAPINFGASGEDSSVIQLVHRVIKEAVERGSSDIHFEPGDEDMRVRYRIDGVLQEAAVIPASAVPAVVSRVKILADLDIAERRIPQDGRISLEVAASRSTSVSRRCRAPTARTSSCESSTSRRS